MNADNGPFKHKQNLFCHQTVLLPQSQPTHFAPSIRNARTSLIPTSRESLPDEKDILGKSFSLSRVLRVLSLSALHRENISTDAPASVDFAIDFHQLDSN